MERVRVGKKYIYNPCLWDLADPPKHDPGCELRKGDIVQVVNLRGCPPANTMSHCYIEKDGMFAGLVSVHSLKECYEMTREERLMPNGIPRWVRCYDNGGETFDRYTVVYTRQQSYYSYVAMSANPYHPQGFGQHGEGKNGPIDRPKYSHLGKKISFKSLPIDCQKIVVEDYKKIWNL